MKYDDALLVTGIMRLLCSLGEDADAVCMEAVRQLDGRGEHDSLVNGYRLDSRGQRGTAADAAVVRAVLGSSVTREMAEALDDAGRNDLAERLRS